MAVKFYTAINANSFVKDGGASTEYLMADGSTTTFAGITGSGTTKYIPKFTAGTVVGDSIIMQQSATTGTSTQLVTDGSFANGSADWEVGSSSWSVASGKATCNGTNAQDPIQFEDALYQIIDNSYSSNDTLSLSFTISGSTTGTLSCSLTNVVNTFTGNGAKTASITNPTGGAILYFYTTDGFDGDITAISVTAVIGDFGGGIGINTSDPKAMLDVNGGIRLADTNNSDDNALGIMRYRTGLTLESGPSGSYSALQMYGNSGWTDVIGWYQINV